MKRQRSRRVAPKILKDPDFADDKTYRTQEALNRFGLQAAKVGLNYISAMTKFNQDPKQPNPVFTRNGKELNEVTNFLYLGAWIKNSEKNFVVQKVFAWNSCHKLHKIWSSKVEHKLKIGLSVSTGESVLLYRTGSSTEIPNV